MERILFTMEIFPGTEEEYKRRHDEIWPELVQALRDSGVANYTLFRRGTEIIAYAECTPDAATAFGSVGATDVDQRWSRWFQDVISRKVDAGGNLLRVEEVWHMD